MADRWIGLRREPDGSHAVIVGEHLVRSSGSLFGGAGSAAAVAVLEASGDVDVTWMTIQFVDTATIGDLLRFRLEHLAEGRSTTQVRLTAVVEDRVVMAGLGAVSRRSSTSFDRQSGVMPAVSEPTSSPRWEPRFRALESGARRGPFTVADFREAHIGNVSVGVWALMREPVPAAGTIAYFADIVPGLVLKDSNQDRFKASLDNTIRFGPPPDTDWLLVAPNSPIIHGDYLHCSADIWSATGTLVAQVTQTSSLQRRNLTGSQNSAAVRSLDR